YTTLFRSPNGIAAKKLVLLSIVVVLSPSFKFATVATAPIVSAKAMVAPPCSTFGRVHRSSRTFSSPITRSGATLTMDTPINLAKGRGSSCMGLLGGLARAYAASSAWPRCKINDLQGNDGLALLAQRRAGD